jgi:RNA recognition motif-containing protein
VALDSPLRQLTWIIHCYRSLSKIRKRNMAPESTTDTTAPEPVDETKVDDAAAPAAAAEVDAAEATETPVEQTKSVYVGNLAWEVTSPDLLEHFKAFGLEVTNGNVLTSPDGRSKGCGIVELTSPEAVNEAIQKLNDTDLKGRQIFVREDRGGRTGGGASGGGGGYGRGGYGFERGGRGRGRTGSYGGRRINNFSTNENAKDRRVYVGNLSWEVAWQDLKDHMLEAGDVVRAEVIKEPSGRSKGCGIVEFATDEGAKKAIATLTDTELKGRRIFVREDREIQKQEGGGGGRGRGRGRGDYRGGYNNR